MSHVHVASIEIKNILLTALSFLLAFTVRDTLTKVWERIIKFDNKNMFFSRWLVYQILFFCLIFGIILSISIFWK